MKPIPVDRLAGRPAVENHFAAGAHEKLVEIRLGTGAMAALGQRLYAIKI